MRAEVAQYQLRAHTIITVLKRFFIAKRVKDGTPFLRDRDLRGMEIAVPVPAGALCYAAIPAYRHEALLIDGTFSGPQAAMSSLTWECW